MIEVANLLIPVVQEWIRWHYACNLVTSLITPIIIVGAIALCLRCFAKFANKMNDSY